MGILQGHPARNANVKEQGNPLMKENIGLAPATGMELLKGAESGTLYKMSVSG